MSRAADAILPAIIAIAGPIGSGKTTITTHLSARLGWPHAAYGDLIRSIATNRGLTTDRATLQHIGTELIAAGWDALTRQILTQACWAPGEPLILDGLRHLGAAIALTKTVAPLPTIVIYLDTTAAIGTARAHHRDQLSNNATHHDERHPVELDLPAVRNQADLVLTTTDTTPATIVDYILDTLLSVRMRPIVREALEAFNGRAADDRTGR
jgi:cytidylate kinase